MLVRKKVIPSFLESAIEKENDEKAKEILYAHLKKNGDVDTLRKYCEVACDANGYPNMQNLAKTMLENLPQGWCVCVCVCLRACVCVHCMCCSILHTYIIFTGKPPPSTERSRRYAPSASVSVPDGSTKHNKLLRTCTHIPHTGGTLTEEAKSNDQDNTARAHTTRKYIPAFFIMQLNLCILYELGH